MSSNKFKKKNHGCVARSRSSLAFTVCVCVSGSFFPSFSHAHHSKTHLISNRIIPFCAACACSGVLRCHYTHTHTHLHLSHLTFSTASQHSWLAESLCPVQCSCCSHLFLLMFCMLLKCTRMYPNPSNAYTSFRHRQCIHTHTHTHTLIHLCRWTKTCLLFLAFTFRLYQ